MKRAKEKAVINLILLGDPASGKGTQAERLLSRYHFYNLDMGKEVRKPASLKKYDYRNTTAIGKLTPTAVVRNIFQQVITTVPLRKGILFNGNPKMINEAKLVHRLLKQKKRTNPLVIYLSIPRAEVLRRALQRTEYVDGKLKRRDDDSIRALRNRERYYKEQIAHVVTFFKKHYTVNNISGVGSESVVAKRIDAAVDAFIKQKIYDVTNTRGN
jgi:adenylate kinase